MPLLAPALGLAYFPIPKNACTSLKHWWFEATTGAPFAAPPDAAGRPTHIHALPGYAAVRFTPALLAATAGLERLAVLRHPLQRLISAYTNRVLKNIELSTRKVAPERFAAAGLVPDPSFDAFIEGLDGYRALSPSIAQHTQPQGWFLGPDLGVYAQLHRIEDLPALATLLQARLGRPLPLPHDQRSPRGVGPIAPETLRRMERLCAEELQQLAPWYPDPRAASAAA